MLFNLSQKLKLSIEENNIGLSSLPLMLPPTPPVVVGPSTQLTLFTQTQLSQHQTCKETSANQLHYDYVGDKRNNNENL